MSAVTRPIMNIPTPFATHDSEDTRAVSPVIGVILMVAITVILAAVIGSFVLGIGGDTEQTPQATFEVDAVGEENGEGNVTLRKTGGEALVVDDLTVVVENTSSEEIDRQSLDQVDDLPESFRTADTLRLNYVEGGGDGGEGTDVGFEGVSPDTDYRVTLVHEPSDGTIIDRTVRA